jgi:hypothetical protein
MQLIERSEFNAASLATPRLAHNTSSAFHYSGNVGDVAHSLGVYKGKIFLLVRRLLPAARQWPLTPIRRRHKFRSAQC